MMKHLLLVLALALLACTAQAGQFYPGQYTTPSAQVLTVGDGCQFTTITAAKNAAQAGQTIEVYPGTYNEHDLLKKNVNYYFHPGTRIVWIDPVTNSVTGVYSDGRGIFDDRSTGATTNQIRGSVSFYYSAGTNNPYGDCWGNTNSAGAVVVSNPGTDLTMEFNVADGDCYNTCNTTNINGTSPVPALFYISQCRRVDLKGNEMTNTYVSDQITGQGIGNEITGIYWESGNTYVNINHIAPIGGYAIWPNQGQVVSGQLWVKGHVCEGYIYQSANSTNFKSWFQFESLTPSHTAFSAFGIYGGFAYLQADKIWDQDTNGSCVQAVSGATVWVIAEKMTSSGTGHWVWNDGGSTVYCTCQHYEYTDANPGAIGFYTQFAGTGSTRIFGGNAVTKGVGALNTGQPLFLLQGVTLDVSSGTNAAVIATGTNTLVKGCTLLCAASTNSITATNAQTVGVYWSAGNYDKNANVTISPNAGWTVSTATK